MYTRANTEMKEEVEEKERNVGRRERGTGGRGRGKGEMDRKKNVYAGRQEGEDGKKGKILGKGEKEE